MNPGVKTKSLIRPCGAADFGMIFEIINDAASAYRGKIPADCWQEPYMTAGELAREAADGVVFWRYEQDGQWAGVMGIQDVQDVTLIRHAYVRTAKRNQGIGTKLLTHLLGTTSNPVLVGTWKAAAWAIRFYERHGFTLVPEDEKNRLLKKYWSISERQIETSVVLADPKWLGRRRRA